ncbi:MAG: hypothetical protein LAT64_09930 [Phycisphaerales bacterium]|nr:hypothetical protein [Phycisphaerales bacterium]
MRARQTALILAAGGVLGLSGCAGPGGSGSSGRGGMEPVRPEAFARETGGAETAIEPGAGVARETTPGAGAPGGASVAVPGRTPMTDPMRAFGAEPVVVRSTAPRAAEPAPARVDRRSLELIDAKVGDINGRPIYVSSFFAPIEARLMAEAERLDRNAWRRLAVEEIIMPRLDGIIADELLRAEALASLTPQQRQGLRSFLTGFRRDLLSENLGSEQLARRRLETESGRTLDDALREKEEDTLIRLTLFQQINRRINVSWRDIRQRYERDQNVFNPPPTAIFRMIRVPTQNTEAVERIGGRLAADPFGEVAADPGNNFRTEEGGLVEARFEGPFEQGEFFGAAALNERARTLSTGGVVGPFELGSSTYWLHLEEIERQSVSLYDAQLRINQELTLERRRHEQRAYLDRLIERARVSNRDEMLLRLLQIAEERYGPRG